MARHSIAAEALTVSFFKSYSYQGSLKAHRLKPL